MTSLSDPTIPDHVGRITLMSVSESGQRVPIATSLFMESALHHAREFSNGTKRSCEIWGVDPNGAIILLRAMTPDEAAE